MSKVGVVLREYRKSLGLTLRAVADEVGVSVPHLSDIELGRRTGSAVVLRQVARVLMLDESALRDLYWQDALARHKEQFRAEWGSEANG